jgi:hypothetical protein
VFDKEEIDETVRKCREENYSLDVPSIKSAARKDGVNDCMVENFRRLYHGCIGDYFYNSNTKEKNITDEFYLQANNLLEFKAMIEAVGSYNVFHVDDIKKLADKYLDVITIVDCLIEDTLLFHVGRLMSDVSIKIEMSLVNKEKTRYLVDGKIVILDGKEIVKLMKKRVQMFAEEAIANEIYESKNWDGFLFTINWD